MADVDLSLLTWRKSLASDETNCVEVAAACRLVMVRDSKNAEVTLVFPPSGWSAFLGRVQNNMPHAAFVSSVAAGEHGPCDVSDYLLGAEAGSWVAPTAQPGPSVTHRSEEG